ncbi:MAG: ATP-grasp domain-containing protein [Clostridia bacterium]|nr:ATP-grasp domain-containing protein [Clostridia bacterium]
MSVKVLITNVGRRGYLVEYLKQIKDSDIKVYVSDCDKTASGLFTENDGVFILPKPVDDAERYVDTLIQTCLQNDITVVIPVIDPEIDILSQYVTRFRENGIFVLVSAQEVLEICYNKINMNSFLQDGGFLVPKTYVDLPSFEAALDRGEIAMPVIIKPIYGSGSVSTYKVNDVKEVKALFCEGHMIQELIDGQEFGCDVFNDLSKTPVRCVLKKKLAMRSGETDKALTIKDKEMQREVLRLATCLGHIGNLDCDLIKRGDDYYIIDLNPRFGGGYPATHAAGVNLLKLVLNMSQGIEIEPEFENYREHLLVMKEVAIRAAEVDFE